MHQNTFLGLTLWHTEGPHLTVLPRLPSCIDDGQRRKTHETAMLQIWGGGQGMEDPAFFPNRVPPKFKSVYRLWCNSLCRGIGPIAVATSCCISDEPVNRVYGRRRISTSPTTPKFIDRSFWNLNLNQLVLRIYKTRISEITHVVIVPLCCGGKPRKALPIPISVGDWTGLRLRPPFKSFAPDVSTQRGFRLLSNPTLTTEHT